MFLKLICYTYCIFQKVVVLELPQEMKVYIKKNIFKYLHDQILQVRRFSNPKSTKGQTHTGAGCGVIRFSLLPFGK